MSKKIDDSFSGFMPMIDHVSVTEATSMISIEGDLVKAHTVNVVTKNGDSYVFSMDPVDLMRLSLLLLKVASGSL